MKKTIFLLLAATLPWMAEAHSVVNRSSLKSMGQAIPSRFSSSSETTTYEWGCPVAEVVSAHTSAEAVQKVGRECMEEARQAANLKPGVFEVIKVSVIVPDVNVTPHQDGFMLKGTFFLETLVLKGNE